MISRSNSVWNVSVKWGAVWSLGHDPIGDLQNRPLGFWGKALQSSIGNYSLCIWETTLVLLLGLSRDWMLNHGLLSHHVTWPAHQELAFIWTTKPQSWACTATLHHQNVSGIYVISSEQALKVEESYMKCSKCPWSPFLLYHFLSSSMHLCLQSGDRGRLSKADCHSQYKWASHNPLEIWIKQEKFILSTWCC